MHTIYTPMQKCIGKFEEHGAWEPALRYGNCRIGPTRTGIVRWYDIERFPELLYLGIRNGNAYFKDVLLINTHYRIPEESLVRLEILNSEWKKTEPVEGEPNGREHTSTENA